MNKSLQVKLHFFCFLLPSLSIFFKLIIGIPWVNWKMQTKFHKEKLAIHCLFISSSPGGIFTGEGRSKPLLATVKRFQCGRKSEQLFFPKTPPLHRILLTSPTFWKVGFDGKTRFLVQTFDKFLF